MITDSMGFFYAFPESILQGSGGYTTRIRRLYNKDQEFIQQGSGGYTTRIRRLLEDFFGIGATIRIGGEMLCLLYAGFFGVVTMIIVLLRYPLQYTCSE